MSHHIIYCVVFESDFLARLFLIGPYFLQSLTLEISHKLLFTLFVAFLHYSLILEICQSLTLKLIIYFALVLNLVSRLPICII